MRLTFFFFSFCCDAFSPPFVVHIRLNSHIMNVLKYIAQCAEVPIADSLLVERTRERMRVAVCIGRVKLFRINLLKSKWNKFMLDLCVCERNCSLRVRLIQNDGTRKMKKRKIFGLARCESLLDQTYLKSSFVGVSRSERAFGKINVCAFRSLHVHRATRKKKTRKRGAQRERAKMRKAWHNCIMLKRNIFTLRSLANKWIFYSNFANFPEFSDCWTQKLWELWWNKEKRFWKKKSTMKWV